MDYMKELRNKIGNMTLVVPHSVMLVFNSKNEILLEERADDGYFDFPGGGIDVDELAEDAAKRELLEETGLIADEAILFKVYSGPITHYRYWNGNEISGVDCVYICKKYHGNLLCQKEEVSSLFFCSLDNMPEKMSIRNKQIIEDLKSL